MTKTLAKVSPKCLSHQTAELYCELRFRKCPPQDQNAAIRVQNEGKKKERKKTETGGVKTPDREASDGNTNQRNGETALLVFYSRGDSPAGGCKLGDKHLSVILT